MVSGWSTIGTSTTTKRAFARVRKSKDFGSDNETLKFLLNVYELTLRKS